MNNIIKRSIFLILGLIILSSCGNDSPEDQTAGSADAENVLTIAQGKDLKSFDTTDNRDSPSNVTTRNLYSRLFKRENPETMEIVPELVEEYEMVDDDRWMFKLREDVQFHNGDSLTAEDVEFTLTRLATDKEVSENVYFGPVIESVNVISEFEFEIKTHGSSPTLLALISKNGSDILPKKYIEEVGWDEFEKSPIGSGPYKYVERIKDDRVVLEANENYFEGEVTWDKVIIRAIPENSTRVSELLTGGIDIATNIPPNDWERVNENESLKIVKSPTARVMTLIVRTGNEYITGDPKIREAIDLAIDKDAIVDQILQGSGTPIRTRVVDASFGANPELQNTSINDVEAAKQLLKDFSEEDLELTLQAPQGRYLLDSDVSEMLANMLSDVGFKVNLELMETSNFSNAYSSFENKELMFIGLGDPMMDASYSLNHFHSDNAIPLMDYSNSEIDELFEAAGVNMDSEEREKQYYRIQEIVAEERPQILLYSEMANFGVNSSLSFTPYINEDILFNEITKE